MDTHERRRESLAITEAEVRRLVEDWFEAVRTEAPLDVQLKHFAPGVKVEAWTGATFDIPRHMELHRGFADEAHRILSLAVTAIEGRSDRVRVEGEVEWEATIKANVDEPRRIKAIVGEEWTVERGPGGQARFVHYYSKSIRYLSGSATLDLPRR